MDKTITFTAKELEALKVFLFAIPCTSDCAWEPHPSGESCKGCEFLELTKAIERKVGCYDK